MRRHDREIKVPGEIEAIIQRAQICRVGLAEDNVPYVVPVHFGYAGKCLYFHCATQGKKLDIIRRNNNVCFEIDTDYQLVRPDGPPCKCSARYRSVIGFGKASVIEDRGEKAAALNIVSQHYGSSPYQFSDEEMEGVAVVKIDVSNMTGKQAGYEVIPAYPENDHSEPR